MELANEVLGAWASLAGLDSLSHGDVFVDRHSPLCPPGWIGILRVDDRVVASVPREDLRESMVAALDEVTTSDATSPASMTTRIPGVLEALGPALLFYADRDVRIDSPPGVEQISEDELETLLTTVSDADRNESGLDEALDVVFASRNSDGAVVAACGYRRWPNHVAHLCVLTHPDHRQEGHGHSTALAAIAHAQIEDLLPQWRARPIESQAVARKLGLTEVGAQLSLKLTIDRP